MKKSMIFAIVFSILTLLGCGANTDEKKQCIKIRPAVDHAVLHTITDTKTIGELFECLAEDCGEDGHRNPTRCNRAI